MPKWNVGDPLARQYLLDAAVYWAKKRVDGFRLDVANETSHSFWREFRETVKNISEDIFIVGEVWESANPWLLADQWDSAMHYPLAGAIHKYVSGHIDGTKLPEMINTSLVSYPKNVTENLFTLLGSHDTSRILTYAGGNAALVKQAFTLLFTLPGSPCIFYGDELGSLEGKGGDLTRKCMLWDKKSQNSDMSKFISRLIDLRKTNPAMRTVDITWLRTEKDHIVYEKSLRDDRIIVILNCLDRETEINLSDILKGKRTANLLTGQKTEYTESFLIEPLGIRILEL